MNVNITQMCKLCAHYRRRKNTDKLTSGYNATHYKYCGHWCRTLDMPVYPSQLRCGGDDFVLHTALKK